MSPVAKARWLLVALVLLVMGRTLLCDWTWWDDQLTIHQNPQMIHVQWDTFIDNWVHPTADIYIPLTYTVWGLLAMAAHVPPDAENIALNPVFFHAMNVLVHAGGAIAAFALLRRLLRDDRAALIGAALWAVHPVQVESVAWISGLKDVMAGTLALTSMALYVRWRQDGPRWAYWSALAIYVLAMLSKPSAFTTPAILIALDALVVRTPWRRVAVAMVPFALVTLPIAALAKLSQPALQTYAGLWLRPLIVGDSIAFYILKVLFPLHLVFDYGHNTDVIRQSGEIWVGWLLPAAIALAAAVWMWRRHRAGTPVGPLPALAGLAFVLAPLHVLGFTQFDFQFYSNVADHYLYVAMIGPALLLGWLVRGHGKAVGVAAAVLVGAYGVRAAVQTAVWQDSPTLHAHCLSINPRSWICYTNDAAAKLDRGDIDGERANLLTALQIQPRDLTANMAMMNFYLFTGDYHAADRMARQLLDLYLSIYHDRARGMVVPFLKVAGNNLTVYRFDAADKYVDEGLKWTPGDPSLLHLKQAIAWMRKDPHLHAATAPATTAP